MRTHKTIAIVTTALLLFLLAAPMALASQGVSNALQDFRSSPNDTHGLMLLNFIPGVNQIVKHVVAASIMFTILLLISVFVGRDIRRSGDQLVPSRHFGLRSFVEMLIEAVLGLMRDIIGPDYKRYFPLIGTLAFFILFSNVMGLVPGLYTSTDNINTNAAMALTVFFSYHYWGIRAQGFAKYMKHMATGGVEGVIGWVLMPLLFPIEIISHLARPLSLTLRLFGNMFGDHKVMAMFVGLIAIPNPLPVPFFALGLVVAVVQTLVFCLLACVYISLATAHEE
ncbi:MAG: F0F1 ATP synthase subunit A [Candidatus Alcyoniella australis]|nr:F0F1 ATP synthase subunit A [Candidatus Alcyoniella australis]